MLNFYEFKNSDKISNKFKKQINDIGNKIESNIKKLSDATFSLFQKLPNPEKLMKIRYEFQQNKKLIGIDEFNFDVISFQRNCDFVEEFWLGKRKAIPVGETNKWKCNYCEFKQLCQDNKVEFQRLNL